MRVLIVPLTVKDAKGLCALFNSRVKENAEAAGSRPIQMHMIKEYVKTHIERMKKHEMIELVAKVDGKVVGDCSLAKPEREARQHVGLLEILVHKDFRDKGIGTLLMKKIIAHAKKMKLEIIELGTHEKNIAAQRLYRKFGFQEVARIPRYIKWRGNYYSQLIMHLYLK